MICVSGVRECDGCMNCQEQKIVLCDKCGFEIANSYVYLIDDMILCEECVDETYVISIEEAKEHKR